MNRTAFPVVPPRVDYALTQKGGSLLPVVVAMRDWGTEDLRSPSMDVGDWARVRFRPLADGRWSLSNARFREPG